MVVNRFEHDSRFIITENNELFVLPYHGIYYNTYGLSSYCQLIRSGFMYIGIYSE